MLLKGCDGSILIDSVGNNVSEKEAGPNLTVRGFEIIDEAKALLEYSLVHHSKPTMHAGKCHIKKVVLLRTSIIPLKLQEHIY